MCTVSFMYRPKESIGDWEYPRDFAEEFGLEEMMRCMMLWWFCFGAHSPVAEELVGSDEDKAMPLTLLLFYRDQCWTLALQLVSFLSLQVDEVLYEVNVKSENWMVGGRKQGSRIVILILCLPMFAGYVWPPQLGLPNVDGDMNSDLCVTSDSQLLLLCTGCICIERIKHQSVYF